MSATSYTPGWAGNFVLTTEILKMAKQFMARHWHLTDVLGRLILDRIL
jgi:hypothetical protein